ncbi:hypothetical protein DEA8626_00826 [Defluviimonas aquaemixtae]|uniref:Uncharacterized protein n=1 Tax=Albidovulum aquaemixtae TaxID=1542388 RepID=A0A2R8B3W6_9RHOB|nr:hypothetical protein [Defluviimonas aquaemixtae]SPH17308.1 hypothetical protein DEA8626_00826 [Defluviimonas aquaemixtae]
MPRVNRLFFVLIILLLILARAVRSDTVPAAQTGATVAEGLVGGPSTE